MASPAPDPQPPIPDEYEENTDGDETDSIRDLDDGLSCDELATDTWGYEEAISYWAMWFSNAGSLVSASWRS